MGQSFHLVAPKAKLAAGLQGDLGEILFDDSANELVQLLIVPVRPQHYSPRNFPIDSASAIYNEKRVAKGGRDDNDAHTGSPRRKQIKVEDRNEKIVPNAVVTLLSLPLELHRLIFSFIEYIEDAISFGMTNWHFLPIAYECVDNYFMSHFGEWAGTNIVCVGEDVEPNDYPPGLFSTEELEVLRQKTIDIARKGRTPNEVAFTLMHFSNEDVCTMMEWLTRDIRRMGGFLSGSCIAQGFYHDPAFRHIIPQIRVENETYAPTDQQWILRNLTTKQIVRSDAIAVSPDCIRGPYIRGLGFGEVVMSRISWSTSSFVSMVDTTNISRGVWAGHCFDITTLSRHEAETRGEEWSDVSDEVAREIASIWESEYGADWREIVYNKPFPGLNERFPARFLAHKRRGIWLRA